MSGSDISALKGLLDRLKSMVVETKSAGFETLNQKIDELVTKAQTLEATVTAQQQRIENQQRKIESHQQYITAQDSELAWIRAWTCLLVNRNETEPGAVLSVLRRSFATDSVDSCENGAIEERSLIEYGLKRNLEDRLRVYSNDASLTSAFAGWHRSPYPGLLTIAHGPSRPRDIPSMWCAEACQRLREEAEKEKTAMKFSQISYLRSRCEANDKEHSGPGRAMMKRLLLQLIPTLLWIEEKQTPFTLREVKSSRIEDLCKVFSKLLQYSTAGIHCFISLCLPEYTGEDGPPTMDPDMTYAVKFLAKLADDMATEETAEAETDAQGDLVGSRVKTNERVKKVFLARPVFKLLIMGDEIGWCNSRKEGVITMYTRPSLSPDSSTVTPS